MKKTLCILLILSVMLQLAACGSQPTAVKTANLTGEISPAEPMDLAEIDVEGAQKAAADFAISLLQASRTDDGENLILSPYSALYALAMAANGADGETLTQMEAVFGMSSEELNTFLYLCSQKEREELSSANSIWVRDDKAADVRPQFLQTNTDYLRAQIFRAAFDDQTLADINGWVSVQTKERIKEMLPELDADAVMILLNALSFDGEWESPFEGYRTHDSLFYPATGEAQEVQMMSDTVYGYLEDGKATGFVKDYKNGYSFVALLPNEGVSMEEYVASLSGSALLETIAGAREERVEIAMPKLEAECSLELGSALAAMGMEKAFSRAADFSRIDGTKELYISKVLHKTYLKIDEEGTEAAASTAIDLAPKSAPIELGKSVLLNRPFVIVVMDRENNTVLFAGIVNRV